MEATTSTNTEAAANASTRALDGNVYCLAYGDIPSDIAIDTDRQLIVEKRYEPLREIDQ